VSRPCLGTQTEYECEDDDDEDAIKDGIFLCVEADSGLVGCGGGGRGMKKLECRM